MFNALQTVQTTPNSRVSTTSSIVYQLQWVSPKVPSWWVSDQVERGLNVQRYRQYSIGNHDAFLTDELRNALRITSDGSFSPFADSYMDAIIQSMADRCTLQSIAAPGNDEATKWSNSVWEYSRMDALQGDVHEATIRDGDCAVMVTWDESLQQVRYTLEEVFDGNSGMLFFYRSKNVPIMDCAIKIWQVALDISINVLTRVNVYFPDHVEKYYSINQGTLSPWQGGDISIPQYKPDEGLTKPNAALIQGGGDNPNKITATAGEVSAPTPSAVIHFDEEPQRQYYTMRDGTPLGIPVIHFRNRGRQNYGYSEIKTSMPLQDALNRIMYSLVINAEYNGFNIIVTRGFQMKTALRPGSIIEISPDQPITKDLTADASRIEAGNMQPFIQTAKWLTGEMGKISRTPTAEFDESGAGGRVSGEALKMREIGLIGKSNRFMTKAGNAWEDVFMMANRIEQAYGNKEIPTATSFKSNWRSAEIRDDAQTVQNALAMRPIFGDAQTLRTVASVFDLDEQAIDHILEEKARENIDKLAQLSSVPTFSQFNEPIFPTPVTTEPAAANTQVTPMDVQGQGNQESNPDALEAATVGVQEVTAQ